MSFFIDLADVGEREMIPGFFAKFVHAGSMTVSFWEIRKGHSLPEHSHPHEQVTNLIQGSFEMTVEGETKVIGPGSVVVIPPNARHSAKSLTDCIILDVFHPVRDDYRQS